MDVDTFLTRAELEAAIGGIGSGQERRADETCILATVWVKHRVGIDFTAPVFSSDDSITLVPEATTMGRKAAALAAATRFWNSPQAPFGVIGGLEDAPTYVSGIRIPEAELALLGEREGFGIG